MTKQQEIILEETISEQMQKVRFDGLRAGAAGMLGSVLEMCKEGKTIADIQQFCETMLNLKGIR